MKSVTGKIKLFVSVVTVTFIFGITACATTGITAQEKSDLLGTTLAKISKLTWGIQDLKRQGLADSHKEVSAKSAALAKKKAKLKELLESGVKPDEAIVPVTGETLLKYSKRRKMTPDVVSLLKKHGATK
ncbi:MAG: hypothetical protein V3S16_12075 [Candidatus Desulfatibia sp.]|uniref:hypothetical protein n=1 Tax=Candidatus Desulfatibia sp. TaxID=3101189 RepID=UPI002F2DAF60